MARASGVMRGVNVINGEKAGERVKNEAKAVKDHAGNKNLLAQGGGQ